MSKIESVEHTDERNNGRMTNGVGMGEKSHGHLSGVDDEVTSNVDEPSYKAIGPLTAVRGPPPRVD